jgi:hypothetical protein
MESYDSTTCSFVVKVWVEVDAESPARPWRGHVTAIPSGEEKYFLNLAELSHFVETHLRRLRADVALPDPE